MTEITYRQFIRRVAKDNLTCRFCFILGAGASKSSGIPTGAELAEKWIAELKADLGDKKFQNWRKEEQIDKRDYARYYPRIFAKRFEADHQASYDYLERTMQDAEPSCGYSFLARILEGGQHNLVITTNFTVSTTPISTAITPIS